MNPENTKLTNTFESNILKYPLTYKYLKISTYNKQQRIHDINQFFKKTRK